MRRKYAVATTLKRENRESTNLQTQLVIVKCYGEDEARGFALRTLMEELPDHELFSQCCVRV
jgi:hypothetical protein